ncbi:MAG TPA: GerMN domain-containing protein [Bacillota bacterium]|nr:GerMN domain-containing protein [Bacillota bacterium]
MKVRSFFMVLLTTNLLILLAGCFKGEQTMEEMDPPQDAEAVDQSSQESDESEQESDEPEQQLGTDKEEADANDEEQDEMETAARQLYLIDVNGMVVPQTLELPNIDSNEVAKQVLEYLVKDGPVTSILPNGFQAVLPAGTEILGLRLEADGTMIVDVSEEFKDYEPEEEAKILEAMTYTLTQFENVDKIKLWINGHPQDEMPVDGTPISDGYSRTNGINIIDSDALDLMNSHAVTMYFPTEHNDTRYYVPTTQHVEDTHNNIYYAMVQALLDGPSYDTNVIHVFNTETALVDEPVLNDGVLELVFNQSILKDQDEAIISDEVMETLVRSLTEDPSVEALNVKVENVDQIVSENGEVYDEPVNKESFVDSEKL